MQSGITYLPVLVMIISVSRSWNLSQRSFVSNTHSTIFNSSQLHLDRIRILSSLEPFFFITWVAFGRLEVVESLLLWGDGGCCCWCEFVFGEMLLLWLPFWEDEEYLKLSLIFSSRFPSTLHRSISTSSWPLWFPGTQKKLELYWLVSPTKLLIYKKLMNIKLKAPTKVWRDLFQSSPFSS